jgi:hypothetical protein
LDVPRVAIVTAERTIERSLDNLPSSVKGPLPDLAQAALEPRKRQRYYWFDRSSGRCFPCFPMVCQFSRDVVSSLIGEYAYLPCRPALSSMCHFTSSEHSSPYYHSLELPFNPFHTNVCNCGICPSRLPLDLLLQ